MGTTLSLLSPDALPEAPDALIAVGRRARLADAAVVAALPEAARAAWGAMLESARPGDAGEALTTWLPGGRKVVAAVIPDAASRHNTPARPDAVAALVGASAGRGDRVAVLAALDDAAHATPVAAALARAFPLYSRKSPDGGKSGPEAGRERAVEVALLAPDGPVDDGEGRLAALVDGIRLAARLVDMPTSELSTDALVAQAWLLAAHPRVEARVIQGRALRDGGFGGLWGVGKAADHPPALAVLTYEPAAPRSTVAWVGKGIVYDTGGLSLKGKTDMPGMKGDMGGAAAVLGALSAAVQRRAPHRIHAVLCLAENAIGPSALRPDDILTLYSGRTVEVNNTDAEGRLVLADGVAYAAKHLAPDAIVDLATLTGAQLVATGRRHAAVVSNDEAWEARAVAAGRRSGDLVHPLPWVPELLRAELESKVADMKNSVKDRMNAQSSCAALFIAEHLAGFEGPWLHVDLAGPATHQERGTGFGVALLLELLEAP